MCFGNKSPPKYDARASGDFDAWKALRDQFVRRQINGTPEVDALGRPVSDDGGVLASELARLSGLIDKDPAAALDMREYARQGDVNIGQSRIASAFQPFNAAYYEQFAKKYNDYYQPQLDRQYTDANAKLTAALAGRGVLESTPGATQLAELLRKNLQTRTEIANNAQDAANGLRINVETARTNLTNLNQASADPTAVNTAAVGQATALMAPPTFSPLGEVFASAISALGNAAGASNNRAGTPYQSPYVYGRRGSTGSGRVIS